MKRNKRPFLLLEVLITMVLFTTCAVPILYARTHLYSLQRRSIVSAHRERIRDKIYHELKWKYFIGEKNPDPRSFEKEEVVTLMDGNGITFKPKLSLRSDKRKKGKLVTVSILFEDEGKDEVLSKYAIALKNGS